MTNNEFIAQHPHPGTDPVARLRHALDLYPDAHDDREVLSGTSGIYPQGSTRLTFGDLRALARMVGV